MVQVVVQINNDPEKRSLLQDHQEEESSDRHINDKTKFLNNPIHPISCVVQIIGNEAKVRGNFQRTPSTSKDSIVKGQSSKVEGQRSKVEGQTTSTEIVSFEINETEILFFQPKIKYQNYSKDFEEIVRQNKTAISEAIRMESLKIFIIITKILKHFIRE